MPGIHTSKLKASEDGLASDRAPDLTPPVFCSIKFGEPEVSFSGNAVVVNHEDIVLGSFVLLNGFRSKHLALLGLDVPSDSRPVPLGLTFVNGRTDDFEDHDEHEEDSKVEDDFKFTTSEQRYDSYSRCNVDDTPKDQELGPEVFVQGVFPLLCLLYCFRLVVDRRPRSPCDIVDIRNGVNSKNVYISRT